MESNQVTYLKIDRLKCDAIDKENGAENISSI